MGQTDTFGGQMGSKREERSTAKTTRDVLSKQEMDQIDAYWRAANYLSVGQIYLYDNPLLRRPLSKEHMKPRLLGHWGTTPGLNFIYAHLNRLVKKHDLLASMSPALGPSKAANR